MKEATGELNITVITIVAIAAVAALFYAFIWPTIRNNLNRSTYCSAAFGCDSSNKNCHYYDENGSEKSGLDCSAYQQK